MIIVGQWTLCADGVTRPMLRVAAQGMDGQLYEEHFLVDLGADRTAFGAPFLFPEGDKQDSPGQRPGEPYANIHAMP